MLIPLFILVSYLSGKNYISPEVAIITLVVFWSPMLYWGFQYDYRRYKIGKSLNKDSRKVYWPNYQLETLEKIKQANDNGVVIHKQDLGIWKDPKWRRVAGEKVSNVDFAMYHLNQAELYLSDEAKVKLIELKALVEK